MNFFSSVFSAPAADEHGDEEEEEAQGEKREGEQVAGAGEEDSGGGWIFGGLIQTLKEEIEEQRREQEAAEAAQREAPAADGEAEAGSGGGWIFGGLIKTLAEEIEAQRKEQDAAEEGEQREEVEAEASAADGEEFEEGEGDGEGSGSGWSFEDLVKTFATRSESVIGGYRRDLQDLGSGLRVETAALRAAAARAAAVLPGALEAGASAASDRLESVGQAVDDLGAAAAILLSQANVALQSAEADGDDGDGSSRSSDAAASGATWRASLSSKKYTRFEAQVLALRADPTTFTEEPEDAEGFAKWRGSFLVDERKEEIEAVLQESPGLESFVERLVPSVVDYETFWCRYFFAVDKLKQAEDVRNKLVSRAMSKEDDEELSWDVDDDDDDDNTVDHKEGVDNVAKNKEKISDNHETEGSGKQEAVIEKDLAKDEDVTLAAAKDSKGESTGEASTPKSSDGSGHEEKAEAGDSSKDSDFSVVCIISAQEEEISWEEIEDVGDNDEKKGTSPRSSTASKVEDLRKRLTSVEDDEDLSWDIDD
ncbi:hypothetical protein PR202_ga23986 [Eleusine coracana subsp. coracana]|uniref:BSD domain-containing protein n=1 Tax=Eleusine coracana subsp. coracana TaxID=191504 RepID=A0AAV5D789_ELECO|nr:hypothetical protein PR202_ga23986 [Eleusine coracana subsp. coracana]